MHIYIKIKFNALKAVACKADNPHKMGKKLEKVIFNTKLLV